MLTLRPYLKTLLVATCTISLVILFLPLTRHPDTFKGGLKIASTHYVEDAANAWTE